MKTERQKERPRQKEWWTPGDEEKRGGNPKSSGSRKQDDQEFAFAPIEKLLDACEGQVAKVKSQRLILSECEECLEGLNVTEFGEQHSKILMSKSMEQDVRKIATTWKKVRGRLLYRKNVMTGCPRSCKVERQ